MSEPPWFETGARNVWRDMSGGAERIRPLPVVRTEGVRLHLADGRVLVDGCAWTACHGYNHPHIIGAMRRQLETMPHVVLNGLAHEPAYVLAHRLAGVLSGDLNHVCFAESGSLAVELAMKMALQYWSNRGRSERCRFLSFHGGRHGETIAALSLSGAEEARAKALGALVHAQHAIDLPSDPTSAVALERFFAEHGHELAAVIVEPLLQAGGGMRFHEAHVLQSIRTLTERSDCLLIFDEVFTGFGRTGAMFAMERANVVPDIITLSKSLTGGTAPLSAVVANKKVFDGFAGEPGRGLVHQPAFRAYALGCAAGNACLDLFEGGEWKRAAERIERSLRIGLEPCRSLGIVRDVRILGPTGVVELDHAGDCSHLGARFAERGVWLKPFDQIVYLTPALTTSEADLEFLTSSIVGVLKTMNVPR